MAKTENEDERRNNLARIWAWWWRPSGRFSLGALVIVGGVGGIVFWGGFNWALELSNTETFCVSCHEMQTTVFQELKKTVHYENPSGVRAICSDCHVPKEWHYKLLRKVRATNELFHKVFGTVDTPEKFEAARMEMASTVWASMKSTDSRECRNCHLMDSMKFATQTRPARTKHLKGRERGQTCIDCHQGIAHELPEGWEDAYETLMADQFGMASEDDEEDEEDEKEEED